MVDHCIEKKGCVKAIDKGNLCTNAWQKILSRGMDDENAIVYPKPNAIIV